MRSLLRWLTGPWKVYRLKRRTVAQRGTIVAQRRQINALQAQISMFMRNQANADFQATRRARNLASAESTVAAKLRAMADENDGLADLVLSLRKENETLRLHAAANRLAGQRPS